MKKILLITIISVFNITYSQVGIGTQTPNSSAILDLDVSSLPAKKGFLPPLVNLTNNNDTSTISTPINGMSIYNLTNGGTGAQLVKGNRFSFWDTTKWQTVTNLQEIRSLKQPIDYINTSELLQDFTTDNTLTNYNNSEAIVVKWVDTDEVIKNPTDISLSNNIFTIKTTAAYQLSGSVNFRANLTEAESSQVILAIQKSTNGTTWTSVYSTSTPLERLIGNKVQTLAIPQILHRFSANDLIRIVLYKPNGNTNAGTNAGIAVNNTGDTTKNIRITRIRE